MLFQLRNELKSLFGYQDEIRAYLPVIVTAILYAIVALISYAMIGNKAPPPFSPLNSAIDWASWFDVIIAFPILSILCAIPFVGTKSSHIVVPLILISPIFLILNSFFIVYNLSSLGLLLFVVPIIQVAPVALVISVYVVPLVLVLIAAYKIPRNPVQARNLPRDYFVVAAAASLFLIAIDLFMRYNVLGNSASLISVVSDVGWAAQAGAKDLILGINPYSAALPPWGGSAPLSYGPMEFILLAPFAPLSIDVGSHVASAFYAFLAALGIFMAVREIRPSVASAAALTFIALPVTYYDVSASFAPHIIAAALIAWAVFFYVTSRYRLSGLFLGFSGLTIGIPFALILPFIFPLRKFERLRMLEGYLPIVAILLAGIFVIFDDGALTSFSAFTGVVSFYGVGMYLTPMAESILTWIPAAALGIWYLYASLKGRTREDALRTGAIFMMLLPFAVGYFFAFFFIWQGLLLIIYLFIRMEVNTSWTSSSGLER